MILKDLVTQNSKCLHGWGENHGGFQWLVSTTINTLECAMLKFKGMLLGIEHYG